MENGVCNVAEKSSDQVIIGYIIFMNLDYPCIASFAVDENHRSQGIGNQLMSKLLEELDCQTLFLQVRESNIRAQKFYERHGFVIVSVLDNYYSDENVILMTRKRKLLFR